MKTAFLVFLILISSNVFAQTEKDFETLANWMQGAYTSEEQSKNDSDYYSISLKMIRIWNDRTDGYWFYVEQAALETITKPYRQRISHLVLEEGRIKNIIFSLPDEHNFIGGYNNTLIFYTHLTVGTRTLLCIVGVGGILNKKKTITNNMLV